MYKRKHKYLKRKFSVVKYICVYAYAHGLPYGLVPVGVRTILGEKHAGKQEVDQTDILGLAHNKN